LILNRDERNLDKSRYRDVIPGEATRVKLLPDGDERHDFINANYVSGYNNQERAYIFAQGPLESTVKDFWRMVWQENIVIIVMTTNIREKNMLKCYPYWPLDAKETLNTGIYQIQNERCEKFDSFTVTILTLRKKNSSEQRTIYHAHYLKWPDHGIPSNTKDALEFLDRVDYYRQITMTKAPILLHCSAGIGRTGTFCAIDIGIKRYLENKFIDIPSTVAKMRTERAGSVQTEDQYVFAYLALKDFIEQQLVQEKTIESSKSTDVDLIEVNTIIDLVSSIYRFSI
jgi:protein tyrosine phosphatase